MRYPVIVSLLLPLCLLTITRTRGQDFDLPLRINCGGRQVTDSNGNIWLADEGVNVDPLNIRPDDMGGGQAIVNWSGAANRDSVTALGFDGNNEEDMRIFRDIRWDNAGEVPDWYMEIPLPDGFYTVNFYLVDGSDNRNYRIELEGDIVEEHVHQMAFPVGEGMVPGPNIAGKYSFDLEVEDGFLSIGMLPHDHGDRNPILQGLEIIPTDPDAEPCDNPAFRGRCASRLQCEEAGGEAAVSWTAPGCFEPLGYEVYRNNELILELSGDETSFEDVLENRNVRYRIETLVPDGIRACPPLTCSIATDNLPFDLPLRINCGGRSVVDSNGNTWLADEGVNVDPLNIRPDDMGGGQAIVNWSGAANRDSVTALGFDGNNEEDMRIFRDIRWDNAGEAPDWYMEIPLPDGFYTVNFYLVDGSDNRNYRIELEGDIVEEHVHQMAFPVGEGMVPGPNIAGIYSFDLEVEDGSLSIGMLPHDHGDRNPILQGLEILPLDPDADPCDRPAFRGRCTSRLQCEEAGGEAAISWTAPGCFEPLGYEVYRNNELILELSGDETRFEDVLESRNTRYQIETLVPDGIRACPPLTCSIASSTMPFAVPLRINFAGPEVTDSNGNVWLGDQNGPGDPLGIRPDDGNGANHIPNWCATNFASVEELGFDPFGPMASVLSSIRWDSDSFNSPFELELPVPDGEYTVNLFFIECCCANRHFSISLEDEMVYDDVHQGDFVPGPDGAGGIGFYSFEGVEVFDGSLSISFVGIPGGDVNALVAALELIPEDLVVQPPAEICDNGIDDDRDGKIDCDDVGCILAAACIPAEICGNGIDDDRDGRVDCDDDDCAQAANCGPAGPLFVRGDANSDGSINLTDGVVPLLYLFTGGAAPACLDSADTNDTGTVEITDAIIIFSWLFSGGAPPAEPSPLTPGYSPEECAADPTEDGIGCARPSTVCN